MTQVDIITSSSFQTMILKLENGQLLNFSLWYSYSQNGWFYSFTYGTYSAYNQRVVNSINMLRKIRNIVPFGLACLLTDKYEPIFIDDFKTGRAKLYTLNSEDVEEVENVLKGLA